MDLEAELKQVETLFSSLENEPTLTASQLKSLNIIITLIEEKNAEFRQRSQAARSRRKAARILLRTIYEHLGEAILFLCSVAIPITKLNEINRQGSSFVSKLQNWSTTIQIKDGIRSLARFHFPPSRLSKLGAHQPTPAKRVAYFDTSPSRRLRTDSSMPKHEAIPSFHGVLDLTASHRPTETPIDDDSNGSEGDDGDGSEASDESDPGGAWAADNPHSTLEGDVPLYSNVFALTGMDVIRVIANQETTTCRLTVPHLPDSMPFITVNCPRSLAMHFVTRREPFKW